MSLYAGKSPEFQVSFYLEKLMARILFVDDDWTSLHLYEKVCTFLGHQAILVDSGKQAVSIATAQTPDLILLDRQLPDADGFQVLSTLHKGANTARIPVVILSAGVSQQDEEIALAAGARSYLPKPLSLVSLQDIISKYCL